MKEQRVERAKEAKRPPAHPYVQTILGSVQALLDDNTDERNSKLALGLANIAAAMEYGKGLEIILEALSRGGTPRGPYFGLLNLVLAGEHVPVRPILAAYDEVYGQWETEPWRQNEIWYLVEEWLELMVFSDTPQEAFRRILALPENCLRPYRLRRIMRALGHCPAPEAVSTLEQLAEKNPDLYGESEWVEALESQGTEGAARTLLDVLSSPEKYEKLQMGYRGKPFARSVARAMEIYPPLREEMLGRVSEDLPNAVRETLASVMQWVQDDEMLLAALDLLCDEANPQVPDSLWKALEYRVTNHTPISEQGNIFTIEPVTAASIRKRLFDMMHNDPKREEAARAVLEWIDRQRDEYGCPEDEPRHPDIATGLSWPSEAKG